MLLFSEEFSFGGRSFFNLSDIQSGILISKFLYTFLLWIHSEHPNLLHIYPY